MREMVDWGYDVVENDLDSNPIMILLKHQKLKSKQIDEFVRGIYQVAAKKTYKKNGFWIFGIPDSGKTYLLRSFIDAYFKDVWGSVDTSSNFMFGNCTNKRVILFEEPFVSDKHYDMFKNILGGAVTPVDVKYQTAVHMQRTPIFLTSNKPLWINSIHDEAATMARVFRFNFNIIVDYDSKQITKKHWDQLFVFYNKFLLFEE